MHQYVHQYVSAREYRHILMHSTLTCVSPTHNTRMHVHAASSPWGGWESLPHPSEMIADGEYVIGAEEEMFSGLTLQEVAVLHPEAIAMDCS